MHDLTIHELREKILNKEINVINLIEYIIKRISELEPKINAFTTFTFDKAREKAKEVQDKIDKGQTVGRLAGIPIGIKDNICTKGIKTTCSSKMLENFIPPYDATVVEKLEAEDAIIIGKLNMDEFAMGSSTESSYFKQTKNPYNLDKVPGGSSGGSAAAISSDMVYMTLGSDTGGSIRQPAALCGCTGLKPTYSAVSRYGLIAFASSLDQIGPIAKDVEDIAITMNVIAGHDCKDTTSSNIVYPDYTKALINDVKGLKIGLPKEYFIDGMNKEVRNKVEEAINKLKELGAEIIDISLPMTEYALPVYYLIATAEASSNLARYDGIKYGHRTKDYTDLIDLYKQSRTEGFGSEVKRRIMLGTYALSSGYYDAYYKKAQQVRTMIKSDFDKAFDKVDVILTPTVPNTAFKFGEKTTNPIEMYLEDIFTVSINIAGLPAISIPCGLDNSNMPIGLQIIGKAFGEEKIIQTAYTYQQNTTHHKTKPNI